MAGVRFTALQSRPLEFLDFTSVTLDAFRQLIPPFEAAFQAWMAAWRMDGKPRTVRRFTVYKNCPLPTPEDRLLFILVYVKTYCPPGGARALIRHGPEQSQPMDSCPPPGVLAALCALGDAPARSLTALAQRLGVSVADTATVVTGLEEAPAPLAAAPAGLPPFCP